MRFDIMTLFPETVDYLLGQSILGRAQKSGAIEVFTHNIRDYSEDKHHRVDDTPYGGGKGMLMAAPPIYGCYTAILRMQAEALFTGKRRVIYLSPAGKVLTQARARSLSEEYDNLILLCGHYEGIDYRVVEEIVDEEISIGDFVLTGGEVPACILVDCVSRLLPGVLSDPECFEKESLSGGRVEYPQYTRPFDWRGRCVPAVLTSGNHAEIDRWREAEALRLTREKRPDLLGEKETTR